VTPIRSVQTIAAEADATVEINIQRMDADAAGTVILAAQRRSAMFIDVVPNGRSAPAVLLRESLREGRKVRKRTLANLGQLPPAMIDGLRVLLQGGAVVARPEEVFEIQRAFATRSRRSGDRDDAQA
jgi:hypothetical protein